MFDKVKSIFRNLTWWGRDGVAPKGVKDAVVKDALSQVNHLASSKFTICLLSILICVTIFLFSTAMLFLLPATTLTAFTAIHHELYMVVALVVSVMIGAQGLVSIANNNSSSVATQQVSELINENKSLVEEKNITIDQELRVLGARKTTDIDDEHLDDSLIVVNGDKF